MMARLPRPLVWLCMWLALLARDAHAATPVPYAWLPQDTHDVRTVAGPDALDVETTGGDPWVAFSPREAVDPKSQSVLAFDYFCPEGIANLSVYYGEPWSGQRAVRDVSLPKAEGWQPFRVNLGQMSEGKFGQEGGTNVRLSLGTAPGVRIQLRNVRVEAPTAEDRKSAGELQAEHERRLVRNQDVLDYLDARFAYRDAAARLEGSTIRFTASMASQEKPTGDLLLAQFPIWSTPWLLMQGQNAPPASASGIQIESAVTPEKGDSILRVSASIPRVVEGRDRLASRWALVEKAGDGYRLLSPAVYLDDRSLPSKFASEPIVVTTKKGMGGVTGHVDELVELGVGSVTVNLTPADFFRLEPGPGRMPFHYQNRTYYFTEEGLAKYDGIVKACAEQKIKVALIVLIQWGGPEGVDRLLPHPAASRAGTFPMPNMTTEAATDAYGAILAFLAERWGDRHGEHGYAPYWILHNEVDYGWTWTNMGETPVGVYVDTYVRSMRLCSLLARQFNPDARVFISLTHNWNAPPDPKLHTYAPKQMLELLARFSKQEGDFPWGVAYHPYPERLFEAAAWSDKPVSFSYDTRFITPKNIEVLDAFMHEPFMRSHGGKLRPVILSEQGFNTRDYSEKSQLLQGAGFVYMFHKIRPLESIEGFQNHRWIDANEGGLLLGLRTMPDELHPRGEKKAAWSVYQAIDTPQEAEKTQFAKSIIGIADFSEIPYKGLIEGATTSPRAASGSPREFSWQNPLPVGTSGLSGLRDPFILKEGETWYLTGTGKPFFTTDYAKMGNPKGVPLYSSPDLKTWKFEGSVVPRVEGTWYQDNFWAPEIHAKDTPTGRKFYCTFNCVNEAMKLRGVGLAVADKITGPYTVLTPDKPLAVGNDADLFTDSDGQDYLFISGVTAMKVDLEHARVIGEPWGCFAGGAPEDWDTGPGIGHEGPQVIKIADTYHCFYSSWGRGYEVGYATAKDLHGPWTKSLENPIYGAQGEAYCQRYHKPYTQGPEVPYSEVGHGQPFIGPDGKWWISAHFGQKQRPPEAAGYHGWEQPGYDPLVFVNGEFRRSTPTWTPQKVTLPR